MRLATIWLGLTTGVFLCEGLLVMVGMSPSLDWGEAAKISFFQGVAVIAVGLALRSSRRDATGPAPAPGPAEDESKREQPS